MSVKTRQKRANSDDNILYVYIGEAVCALQHLEDQLSCLIVIKTIPRATPREIADVQLEKKRRLTLGNAIKESKKNAVFAESIQQMLTEFLPERNWLIHGSISRYREDSPVAPIDRNILDRVKSVTDRARKIFQVLEEELLSYCTSHGADMSKVRAAIEAYYR